MRASASRLRWSTATKTGRGPPTAKPTSRQSPAPATSPCPTAATSPRSRPPKMWRESCSTRPAERRAAFGLSRTSATPWPDPTHTPRALSKRGSGARGCRNVGESSTAAAAMEPYFDLGIYTRGTSTAWTSAQTWFDRGLVWSYAFHHEEAIRCFERALEHDPGFALAHWGIAYAIGPNYNKQWEAFDPVDLAASLEKACDEVAAARACADRAAPVERALVEALVSRYQVNDPSADLVAWNADYAEAMRDVYRAYPDELDVAALFADALMNLTPWALWDRHTGLPSEGAATLEAKEVLERALEQPGGRTHPGVVHLYVHLMEMSPFPEQTLPVADELRSLVPDAGHLVHNADAHRRAVRRLQEHARVEPARHRG